MATNSQITETKGVAYAYATSPIACAKGFGKTGCWYAYTVSEVRGNEPKMKLGDATISREQAVRWAKPLPGDWDRYSQHETKTPV